MENTADYIFHGGVILTIDDDLPNPEAIGIKEKRILAVGSKDQVFSFAGPNTKYVELRGSQALLPGFIEPHQHPTYMIEPRCSFVSCSGYQYDSYKQIKKVIEKTVAEIDPTSGKWCVLTGWDHLIVLDLPRLTVEILDEFSRDVPIFVLGASRHDGWANRKAFEVAGITESTEDPEGRCFVRDKLTNKLTGQVLEPSAILAVVNSVPKPTPKEIAQAVDDQWREYACAGFTTVAELLHVPVEAIDKAVRVKAGQPDCPIRLAIYKALYSAEDASSCEPSATLIDKNSPDDKLWFAGVKIVADGSPRCGSCATREPFLANEKTEMFGFPPSPGYGSLNYTDKELLNMVQQCHDQGKQIAIHAHGERAIEQVLNVYEQVIDKSPDALGRRHRMEHLGLCEESHMVRAAKMDLALSFFVGHLYFYGNVYAESVLGEERTNRWAPLSLATKHKLRWTIHQDHPAFPGSPTPFANIQTAVTRTHRRAPNVVYGKEYCVSTEEALRAYTINAAWQIHKEKELGSLTVGKRADLVILSDNPLEVDPFKLEDIKVIDTFLDGRSNNISEKIEDNIDGKTIISYT